MAEIISMDTKRQLSDKTKADIIKKRKIVAIQKVFQCTHCKLKCEKCGTQIGVTPNEEGKINKLRVPYRLCESCSEEYIDYIERLKGKGDKDSYWHNEPWSASWRAWIEYKGSIDDYMRSKEFLALLQELKESPGEE
jgi:hypothetical protein